MTATRTTTIAVPSETHDLTTLETVKAVLKITGTTDDDYLALADHSGFGNHRGLLRPGVLQGNAGRHLPHRVAGGVRGCCSAAGRWCRSPRSSRTASLSQQRSTSSTRSAASCCGSTTTTARRSGHRRPRRSSPTSRASCCPATTAGPCPMTSRPERSRRSSSAGTAGPVTRWSRARPRPASTKSPTGSPAPGESGDLPPEVVAKLARYTDYSV